MPLVGPPLEDLVNILCEAFPDHTKLVTFVRYRLRDDVSRDFVAPGLTLRETAERLIDTLDSKGLLVEFVKLLEKEHPQHQAKLRRIVRELVATPKPKAIEKAAQRLGTREGVLALLSAGTALVVALTSFLEQIPKLANIQIQVPPTLRWTVVGALGIVALWALVRVLRRRSYLLRPEKFLILPEDPHGFIGREREVRDLKVECESRPLVFLLGESGSGKSTLVRIGLLGALTSKGTSLPRLVPIRIDASALEWERGLGRELGSEVGRLSDDQLAYLGASRMAQLSPFDWMAGLPSAAPAKLLVVIDQLDDYFESHRTQLVSGTKLVSHAELEAANTDWRELFELVRGRRIHVLFVCRIDSLADRVFRFAAAVDMPLFQIDAQLVKPLVDEISRPDEEGAVIAFPEAGWTRLSKRLISDLSGGTGTVLPIQMSVTLDGLRKLPWLDMAEYSRLGGLNGLGRQYIGRLIRDAAKLAKIEPDDLLRGLVSLTTEDGNKTCGAKPSALESTIQDGKTGQIPGFERVVAYLCNQRLLRRLTSVDGETVLLYHDYLARPVRHAYWAANAESELLASRANEFASALNLKERWRAMLTIREQVRIVWARLRGRLDYGNSLTFARWSLLRFVPVILLCCIGAAGYRFSALQSQKQYAVELLSRIGNLDGEPPEELVAFHELAASSEVTRLHALRLGISKEFREGIIDNLPVFLHTLVGLQENVRPFAAAITKQMETEKDSNALSALASALWTLSAKLESKDVQPGAAAITKRMKTENDSWAMSYLGSVLGSLSENLESEDAQPLAAAITKRMETENDSDTLSYLGSVLGTLSAKLESKDVQPLAAAIMKRMETENDWNALSSLGDALGTLSAKLESKDVQPLAAAITKRMETEKNLFALSRLGVALGTSSEKLVSKDVQPLAAAITKRMETENDWNALGILGDALGTMSARLESKDVQPLAAAITKRMESENDSFALGALGSALGTHVTFVHSFAQPVTHLGLIAKLESRDVQPLAAAITKRMETENDSNALSSLGDALGTLSAKLETKDVQPLAAAITKRMDTEKNSFTLSILGDALGTLSAMLESRDVQPLAAAITKRMDTENDPNDLNALGSALGRLNAKLESRDVQPGAAAITKRMETENQSNVLRALGSALGGLSAKLESKDVQPLAAAITKRMQTENDWNALSILGAALGTLSAKLESKDVQPGVAAITKRMQTENDWNALNALGFALGRLIAKLESKDVQPLAAAITKRMKTENDSWALSVLGSAMGTLSAKLASKDVQPGVAAITKRMETENDWNALTALGSALGRLSAKLESKDVQPTIDLLMRRWTKSTVSTLLAFQEGLKDKLTEVDRLQRYVDLLKHPLVAGPPRDEVLQHLDASGLLGQKLYEGQVENLDIWKFVDWANDPARGGKYKLKLER